MSNWRTNRKTGQKYISPERLEGTTTRTGDIIISPPSTPLGSFRTVRDFGDDYVLVQNASEVEDILEGFVSDEYREDFEFLLILPGDAEYGEIWGIHGQPYMDSSAQLIYTTRRPRDERLAH